MMSKLFVDVTYPFENPNSFTIQSNVKTEKVPDILADYFHSIIGDGKTDKRPYVEKDVYHIGLVLTMADGGDTYTVYSDTGNTGLTIGILMDVIKRLDDNGTKVYIEDEKKVSEVLNAIYRIEVCEVEHE